MSNTCRDRLRVLGNVPPACFSTTFIRSQHKDKKNIDSENFNIKNILKLEQ
jgi:hypothetical protein